MYPTLFQIGSITISSYSVMVTLAYLAAYIFLSLEIKRRGLDDSIADWVLLAALFGGLGGAKILFLFQNATFAEFMNEPLKFLSSGLTFLGGLIGASILIFVVGIWKKISFWTLTDSTAPGLVLAYGIGRIGCLLVGDDYGTPTSVPWALSFPNGSPPTTQLVHPTQIYDTILMIFIFLILWAIRKSDFPTGWMFSLTLIILGIQRFFIEFIRNTSPSFIDGLSQAQLISIVIFIFGVLNLLRLKFMLNKPAIT
ncbi:MAG TPA: prolipoprotein diacylglyceryl transferase [Thermodesulfobacteriota bacterium]|nr:prolipoprotein diacylglyceryl transferase [Thermodesulfobacteriota bacterium]